jgi:hypothetical protein
VVVGGCDCGRCNRCIKLSLERSRDFAATLTGQLASLRTELEAAKRDIEVYEGLNKHRAEVIDELCLAETRIATLQGERDALRVEVERLRALLPADSLEEFSRRVAKLIACKAWCGRSNGGVHMDGKPSLLFCSPECQRAGRPLHPLTATPPLAPGGSVSKGEK